MAEAVRNLVDHYEELGLPVLRLLGQEDRSPALQALADRSRAVHAEWCDWVFAPSPGRTPQRRAGPPAGRS